MRDIGKKISSMGMGKKYGLMVHSLKAIILMVKNKGKERLLGQMEVHIKEIFMKIIFMEEVYIAGLMAECIMGLGNVIKCMDMVYLLGQMVENMKENM